MTKSPKSGKAALQRDLDHQYEANAHLPNNPDFFSAALQPLATLLYTQQSRGHTEKSQTTLGDRQMRRRLEGTE